MCATMQCWLTTRNRVLVPHPIPAHGDCRLTDSLISSNGIISDKLAGKIRYMDSL